MIKFNKDGSICGSSLTTAQRNQRGNIRNGYMLHTAEELREVMNIRKGDDNHFLQELLNEAIAEENEA